MGNIRYFSFPTANIQLPYFLLHDTACRHFKCGNLRNKHKVSIILYIINNKNFTSSNLL